MMSFNFDFYCKVSVVSFVDIFLQRLTGLGVGSSSDALQIGGFKENEA